jgi:exodeoxyribonuclease-3
MKLATWNVNGIRAREADVLAWLERETPDIVCLQETKAPRASVPTPLREHEAYWSYWHGFKGYSGVALLVHKSLSPTPPDFQHPSFDMENRVVTARIQEITVASIYVPNGGKDFAAKMRFLAAMETFAIEAQKGGQAIVLCGDFNVAHEERDVHPKERKLVTGQLPEEREMLDAILANDLVDLGRHMAPHDNELYSWWAPWRQMKERNIGWRLDYIYVPNALAKAATSCVVERSTGTSDHGPVVAVFDPKKSGIIRHVEPAKVAVPKTAKALKQGELI